jgi:ligand-binding sensor protein
MQVRDVKFADLINAENWQSLQDSISEVLNVSLRTFSAEGKPLTIKSKITPLYKRILSKKSFRKEFCAHCLISDKASQINSVKETVSIKCPFDTTSYIIPIKAVAEKIIAYILLGPVILKQRKGIDDYAKDAVKHRIELENLMDALIEIPVFSYSKISSVNGLITKVFSHMAQTGYHKKRLGEIAPEVAEIDPIFSRYYEEKILNSLLNTCTLILDADSGSVMTLDKKTKSLHIKAASRIDKSIIKTTSIKLGEGIAGVAAKTQGTIILPQDKTKNGIGNKMKRSHIKSSMIIPFNKGNETDPYAVLNLNVVRKQREFSDRDITVVKELINMASVALTPLRIEK